MIVLCSAHYLRDYLIFCRALFDTGRNAFLVMDNLAAQSSQEHLYFQYHEHFGWDSQQRVSQLYDFGDCAAL